MFIISNEYDRSKLLDFVGSKQGQTGIIWGSRESGCVIITSGGRHGEEVGYSDQKLDDGSWLYIGQGSKGNQNPERFANSILTKAARSVLLFSTREASTKEKKERKSAKKFYKFEGIFEVGAWSYVVPNEGSRKGDQLVQYHLIPAKNIFNSDDTNIIDSVLKEPDSLYILRKKINEENKVNDKRAKTTVVIFRLRSERIKKYALKRAHGICEFCNKEAPFLDMLNNPFLEVHHIFRLADDGPDSPENVAAMCPNCHREAHFGKQKLEIRNNLSLKIKKKENKLSGN